MTRCARLLVTPEMTDPRTQAPQCPNEGRWAPVLQIWSVGHFGKPAESVLGLLVCDGHRLQDPDRWTSKEGWAQLEQVFREQGLAAPDRSRTRVRFILETDPLYRRLQAGAPS